jgi:hypothetical protein
VNGDWGTSAPPTDLRLPTATTQDAYAKQQDCHEPEFQGVGELTGIGDARSETLCHQLRTGLSIAAGNPTTGRRAPKNAETFVAIVTTSNPVCPAEYWQVDLGEGTVTKVDKRAQKNSDWDVIGTQEAWDKILRHEVNLSVAFRNCELRYCDNGGATPIATENRIRILGELLGLAAWR